MQLKRHRPVLYRTYPVPCGAFLPVLLPDMLSSDAGSLSYPLSYSGKVMIISLFDSTVMPDKYRHNGK
ncbi:hypothetical protein AM448_20275 [Escherichia coli]|nr:hypothetical protein AM448_20275 [Escherichia coli]ARR35966.1 hypothetical protein CA593_24360 [Escherichia coli]EEW4900871.1 hypothetical protein [Escherichia coli]EFO0745355.1 hypothetical protein [Escherichia coli]EFO0864663.1 hypothetical protein [Escherichia coli]